MPITILVPNSPAYLQILDIIHPAYFTITETDKQFLTVDFTDLNSVEIYAKYHFQLNN